MPVVKFSVRALYDVEAYVTGPSLSKRDVRAIRRGHPHMDRWYHDSFLPGKTELSWFVVLHIACAVIAYFAYSSRTLASHVWLGIAAAILGVGVIAFWDHIFINQRLRVLQRRENVAYDEKWQDSHRNGWKHEWYDTVSWYINLRPWDMPQRPAGFSEWLKTQLHEDAPYFGRVHMIIDAHVRATQYARLQLDSGVANQTITQKLVVAGDVAFELLKPIFEESESLRLREEKELSQRQAREMAYLETENKSLTAQRIAMASEDLDVYIEGHKELAAE